MRLIDADALEELFRCVIGGIAKEPEMTGNLEHMIRASAMVIEMIHDDPTIEQPQVVKCKDCKHGSLYCTEDVCGETLIECNRPDLGDVIEIHGQNWYCADGEVKQNEPD